MSYSSHRPTTCESLARWLAAWLVLALLVQALAFGAAAVRGSAHRHASAAVAVTVVLQWRHAGASMITKRLDAHAKAHRAGEPHHHAVADTSVLPTGADAAADASAQAATFGLAPAPRSVAAVTAVAAARDWVAAVGWAPTARALSPLLHPPQA